LQEVEIAGLRLVLLLWIMVAFVLGIVVGRFIRFGMGGDS
jgi:hypothetical protein